MSDKFSENQNQVANSSYDAEADKWHVYRPGANGTNTLSKIKPGWGYWINAKNDDELVIGGSLFSPRTVPPSRQLVSGWNLIGYYGTDGYCGDKVFEYDCSANPQGKSPYSALYSLVEPTSGYPRWSGLTTYCENDNPNSWTRIYDGTWYGYWYWYGTEDMRKWRMTPGAGYWIFMKTSAANPIQDYLYGPSSGYEYDELYANWWQEQCNPR